jgi:hypothetical protein
VMTDATEGAHVVTTLVVTTWIFCDEDNHE